MREASPWREEQSSDFLNGSIQSFSNCKTTKQDFIFILNETESVNINSGSVRLQKFVLVWGKFKPPVKFRGKVRTFNFSQLFLIVTV